MLNSSQSDLSWIIFLRKWKSDLNCSFAVISYHQQFMSHSVDNFLQLVDQIRVIMTWVTQWIFKLLLCPMLIERKIVLLRFLRFMCQFCGPPNLLSEFSDTILVDIWKLIIWYKFNNLLPDLLALKYYACLDTLVVKCSIMDAWVSDYKIVYIGSVSSLKYPRKWHCKQYCSSKSDWFRISTRKQIWKQKYTQRGNAWDNTNYQ